MNNMPSSILKIRSVPISFLFYVLRSRPAGCPLSTRLASLERADRVGFDLDEHLRVDQCADLHHSGGRRVLAECIMMRQAVLLPAADVSNEQACAHHAGQIRPQVLQGALDDLQAAPRLGRSVARGETFASLVYWCSPGDINVIAGAQGPAVTHTGLPRRTAECAFKLHASLLSSVKQVSACWL